MKNKFLNISIGVTLMLLGAGFFVRSINTANATPPTPKEFIEEGTSKIGKYQIAIATMGTSTTAIILDTETGKNVYYFTQPTSGAWTKADDQMPANPLGN